MNNARYFDLFQGSFRAVSQVLTHWEGDLTHTKLLDYALSKLRDDFMDDKVFPALMAPLLAYQSFKTPDPPFETLAAAHLLFYCFLDLTDDVEDHELETSVWHELGDALAINAGTSLLFLSLLALDHLLEQEVTIARVSELKSLFHEAGWKLTVGQHRDLYSRHQYTLTPEACLKTMSLKTGTSVGLYFESSACLAGAPQEAQTHFKKLGQALGTLMQIRSDYQNMMDSALSSDLKNRQITLPMSVLLQKTQGDDKATLDLCLERGSKDPAAHMILRHQLKKYQVKQDLNALMVPLRETINTLVEHLENSCDVSALRQFIGRVKPL